MHHALQIPEVLLNIFYRPIFSAEDRKRHGPDLAALARTCHAFKGPALDILWSHLQDPIPLSRCLPETSYQEVIQDIRYWPKDSKKIYSFARPLERTEWDILSSYASRVRSIKHQYQQELDWNSLRPSTNFTPTHPLFPSLQSLDCMFEKETVPLLQLPLPSLIRLNIQVSVDSMDLRSLQGPLRSLAKTSPNISNLDIWSCQPKLAYARIISDSIYGWSNLRRLACPEISLDVDNFIHLSRMPLLASLSCMLSTTFLAQTIPSDSPSFTSLCYFTLYAESLVSISRLVSWAQLPSITHFTASIESCPARKDLTSFIAGLQIAGIGHTVQNFSLEQGHEAPDTIPPREPDAPLLNLDDLRPCMAFHNLHCMNLDLQWDVDLSDDDLLTLASAWPRLDELVINSNWGWNRPGGITPDGFTSLLQMCPSLTTIALAFDMRGYIQSPGITCWEPSPLAFARRFHINVLDSVIEQESAGAMAVFLSTIAPHFDFDFTAWETWTVFEHPDLDLYRERWEGVYSQANEAVKRLWLNWLREQFLGF